MESKDKLPVLADVNRTGDVFYFERQVEQLLHTRLEHWEEKVNKHNEESQDRSCECVICFENIGRIAELKEILGDE